jgi:hypothetical protein
LPLRYQKGKNNVHPNNLLNIGTDPSVLVTLILVFAALMVLKAILNRLIKVGYESDFFTVPEDGKKCFRIKMSWTLALFVAIAIPWLIWGGYGPGKAVQLTAVEDTGAAQVIRDTPEPMTTVQIEADAEERRPEVLRQLDKNLNNQENADEIIQDAIRRYNPVVVE